uniref:Oxidoreductase-like domain-containing protein n=1 Tax=Panagrolaimus sp. ES5 TaxID=591445 RepID=A0AC34G4L6_9BILA
MIPASIQKSAALIQKHHGFVLRLISTGTNSSTPETSENSSSSVISQNLKFPEAPDPLSCCGSGCAKCVWIQYADEVGEYFSKKEHNSESHKFLDKYNAVKEEMERNVQDENLRAFLLMEVKAKFSKM